MPRLIAAPTVIADAGNKPKRIEEFVGRANSGDATVSRHPGVRRLRERAGAGAILGGSGGETPNRQRSLGPAGGSGLRTDLPFPLSAARVVAALRTFVTAVRQFGEGYAQGPPGC